MNKLVAPQGGTTFMGAPFGTVNDIGAGGFGLIGAPYGSPYSMQGVASGAAAGPAAIRAASARYRTFAGRYDFDLGGPFFDPCKIGLVDLGDCDGVPTDLGHHLETIEATVRGVCAKGALPILLGGDDSTPIPCAAGLDAFPDVHVLQIDAHLDYRDSVRGHRYGYSSPMRRIREMPHFGKIVHVGARGIGSAYVQDFEDTLAAGNAIVTARQLAKHGVGEAVRHFPDAASVYISIDCDGLDPSVMPGTSVPLPGGIAFYDVIEVIQDLVRRCNLRGIGFAEHFPEFDTHRITAIAITRIISNVIGISLQKNQI